MPFDRFELDLLNDAWEQMREESVQQRLSAVEELRNTRSNNEAWFEWELYYRLLKVGRGWKREKRNRKGKNRRYGDGVDLQFANNRFIELRAVTTEKTNMAWVVDGLLQHKEADACLFLALYHKNLTKWLDRYKVSESRFHYRNLDFEIETKHINQNWIVGIVKRLK